MSPSFSPPPDVVLAEYVPLGFNPDSDDAAYDMSLYPAFHNIPHSASTLTIEWVAGGDGWQGGDDESWAIDNLEIVIEQQGIDVAIDIKPGSDPNRINLHSNGAVPVAVLSTDDFDSASIDPVSVLFAGASPLRWVMKDVDFDGDVDFLFFFKTQELNLDANSIEATLTGTTFDGDLIVGTDSIVIKKSPDWMQVNVDGFGDSQNQQIPSLAVFNGYLYAGTWNAVWEDGNVIAATAQIWRTKDGSNWEMVNETEANGAAALIQYKGYLYSGSWSSDWDGSAKVWRSRDGLNWEFITEDGFGSGNGIARFAVYKNALYASTWGPETAIWRTTHGKKWEAFIELGGDPNNSGAIASELFDGYLYWGLGNWETGAQIWRTNGAATEAVITDGFGTPDNKIVSSLAAFSGSLYAGVWNTEGVQVWRSANGRDWESVGVIGNPTPSATSALEVYAGQLYLVAENDDTGLEVWRTANGVDWEQVGFAGFGDGNNAWSYWDNATAVFKGNLYIATNNFATGGEVWKMCPTTCR
ncbi:MAG: hypothetical protein H6667_02640 [Ardenticatenaceae bacterium]|nr:hypothetical protein [Ardenticatenaceae bacterium]MCB9445638.1 hypothetical protein [Ardenticatenaceae bacterium]